MLIVCVYVDLYAYECILKRNFFMQTVLYYTTVYVNVRLFFSMYAIQFNVSFNSNFADGFAVV